MAELVEDRPWCHRCGIHEGNYGLCPVCADDDRVKALAAASQMASNCRG